MKEQDISIYQYIIPYFTHVVERICTPAWHIKKCVYRQHNIILVYDGMALFGCNGKEYTAGRGDLVYFKPGDTRYGITYPENLMKCFAVDFDYICPIYGEGKWELENVKLPFNTLEKINDSYLFSRLVDLFGEITRTWISSKYNRMLRCRNIFMEMLNLLVMWKEYTDFNYDRVRKVEKTINYMTKNYNKRISLRELADVANLSTSYFGSIFKEVTGKSPIEYLLDIRINRAKELLNEGMSVSETAIRTGFSDVYYFSKCFKNHEGINPTSYRDSEIATK